MSQRLPNYLRTYRKHRTLSQDEVAQLVGCGSRGTVSMYENCDRMPSLKKALAFEAALQVPTRELFAGTYTKVEEEVADRAVGLSEDLTTQEEEVPHLSRKLDVLQDIAAPKTTASGILIPATA